MRIRRPYQAIAFSQLLILLAASIAGTAGVYHAGEPRSASIKDSSAVNFKSRATPGHGWQQEGFNQSPSIKFLPQNFPKNISEKEVVERLKAAYQAADAVSAESKATIQKQQELRLKQLPKEATTLSAAMEKSKDFQAYQHSVKKALATNDPWPMIRDLSSAYLPTAKSLAIETGLDLERAREIAQPIGPVKQNSESDNGPKQMPATPPIEPRTIVLRPPAMSTRQVSRGEGVGGTGHSVHFDPNVGDFNAEAWSATYVGGGMYTTAEFDAGLVTVIPPGYRRALVTLTLRPEHYDMYATAFGLCGASAGTSHTIFVNDGSRIIWNEYNRYRHSHFGISAGFLATGSISEDLTETIPLAVAVRPEGQIMTFTWMAMFSADARGFLCGATSRILINGRMESVTIELYPE